MNAHAHKGSGQKPSGAAVRCFFFNKLHKLCIFVYCNYQFFFFSTKIRFAAFKKTPVGSHTLPSQRWIEKMTFACRPLPLPSFRVHLIEPEFLLTACRFPSSVDTNSRLSGRETVFALQSNCRDTKQWKKKKKRRVVVSAQPAVTSPAKNTSIKKAKLASVRRRGAGKYDCMCSYMCK